MCALLDTVRFGGNSRLKGRSSALDQIADIGVSRISPKHLPYEIEMLRLIHETLHQPYPGDAMANSLIECFCIRARNLIDFFNDCKPPNSKNSVARHFIDSANSPFRSKSRVW